MGIRYLLYVSNNNSHKLSLRLDPQLPHQNPTLLSCLPLTSRYIFSLIVKMTDKTKAMYKVSSIEGSKHTQGGWCQVSDVSKISLTLRNPLINALSTPREVGVKLQISQRLHLHQRGLTREFSSLFKPTFYPCTAFCQPRPLPEGTLSCR